MDAQTRITIPKKLSGELLHLNRVRMDSMLSNAIKSDLVTVVAGPGYGKTDAVYSFLRKQNYSIIWVQLSENDNTTTQFWETFTKAIFSINPVTAGILSDIGFPNEGSLYARYSDAMVDALSISRKYVLVFDDFQYIQNQDILKFIGNGANHNYAHMTRIFISREYPITFIADHLSQNTFAHLDENDLRFTSDEMRDYFELQGISLGADTLDQIYTDTEGWIFAINLVGLHYKMNPDKEGDSYSAIKNNFSKLINSEIFLHLTDDEQRFLIKMSLLNHLSPELLHRLPNGLSLIDKLQDINSLVRYDAYLDTFRMHNLLKEYLNEKINLLTEDEINDTYEKAAIWCLEKGYVVDALNYYEKLKDYDKIVDIAYNLPLLIPPGLCTYLAKILAVIPKEEFERNGTLNIVYSRLLSSLGKLDTAEEFIDITLKRAKKLPESDYKNRLLFGLYCNLGFLGMIRAPQSRDYDFAIHFKTGDEYFNKSNFQVSGEGTSINLSPLVCRVGYSDPSGIGRFIDTLTELVPYASHSLAGCMSGLDDLARSEFSLFKADYDNCERYGYEALYKARAHGQHEIENRALFLMLRANLACGKYNEVKSILSQVETQPEANNYSNRYFLKDIVTGWFYAQVGHPKRIAGWITNDFDERKVNYLLRGLEFFTRNKYYIALKRYSQLLALLDSQDTDSGISAFLIGKISIAVNKAVCLYNINEKIVAVHRLEEAYTLAAPDSLFQPFYELGNEMRALAHFALSLDDDCSIPRNILETIHGKSNTYAKRLIHIRAMLDDEEKIYDKIELTPREKQVLTDLTHGLSRIEIAVEHNFSINTVKTMLPNIYRKLGANNTIDAVRIAITNGLVEA